MIVVFGSASMDTIIGVDHLPTVGETVIGFSRLKNEGGKGANQAIAAAKLGNQVFFFGAVGQDSDGNTLLENFQSYGIDISGINVVPELSGNAYVTVSKDSENTIMYVPGANIEAKSSYVPDFLLKEDSIVLMQMEVPPTENWKLAARAKSRNAKVILNAAPASYIPDEALQNIDILIINQSEALAFAKQHDIDTKDFKEIAKYVFAKYKVICIITLGNEGVLAVTGETDYYIPAINVDSVDTTCAGDAFVGTFVSYLDSGYSIKDCLIAGNIAGALATTVRGSQKSMPSASRIRQFLIGEKDIKHIN